MRVKTYQAQTMREALNKVREDLGEDAVILRTRTLKRAWGLLGQVVEVTAALEDEKLPPLGLPNPYRNNFSKDVHFDSTELLERLRSLEGLVVGIDRTLRAKIKELPEEILPLYEHLLKQGVEEDIARALVQEGETQEALIEMVENLICTKEPVRLNPPHRKVVALVGPTGVGKSTTAAKLACIAKQDGARVALIGTDSKRLGAALQLRAIAEALDIPYRLVFSGKDMEEAMREFEDVDLLLVDCAGASQYEDMALWHLKSLLDAVAPDEVLLLLPAHIGMGEGERVKKAFSYIPLTGLVITKLDEVKAYGNLVNLPAKTGLPIVYITFGQQIPADIAPADKKELASYILGGVRSEDVK